jgi:ubiquinone/menaquinone biosynthesis C-methylase UbiE
MTTSPPTSIVKSTYSPTALLSSILSRFSHYYSLTKSYIYDIIILRMTELWYRTVLQKLPDGSILLDVGIGTSGALLRCVDLILQKNLKVVGIDIDASYVQTGKLSVEEMGLGDRISINVVDVYDGKETVLQLAKELGATENERGQFVDAVYFSGSFSLLPDPVKALQLVSQYVKDGGDEKRGHVYITQTYQRKTPFFLPYIKPLMKYATTIDFGNLVREEEALKTFEESGLTLLEHTVIHGSVDNAMQAAYVSVLR